MQINETLYHPQPSQMPKPVKPIKGGNARRNDWMLDHVRDMDMNG